MRAAANVELQLLETNILSSVVETRGSRIIGVWSEPPEPPTSQNADLFFKVGTGGTAAGRAELEYEAEGLRRLHAAAKMGSSGLCVPRPWLVGELQGQGSSGGDSAFIVMDYVDVRGGAGGSSSAARLMGAALAELHSQPADHGAWGFPLDGVCGALEQLNNVAGDVMTWVDFWRDFRLGAQLRVAATRHPGEREVQDLGAQLLARLPELFDMLREEDIERSLLHGDLWSGNRGVATDPTTGAATPCIFDPAAYYGHAEADLGIAHMFGGFPKPFWDAYFERRPRQPGFERRALLYELHHHLNHLNIFGSGYAGGAVELMRRILK